jgi:hypothetical protein
MNQIFMIHKMFNVYAVHKAMDSMVGNAYLYGRNWIASKVHFNVKSTQLSTKFCMSLYCL